MGSGMDRIRVGVVGIGHLGNYHLQKYSKIEGVEIVGACDSLPDRARKAADQFGCEALTDFRQLLGRVDAVSIAVPTGAHYPVARDFLEAGVHVLLEKPITETVEQADELVNLAEKKGLVFQIGFVERFNPAIAALEGVMSKPVFIEAHRLHPFFERGTDVDVVLDLMVHDLDLIMHFVQSPVKHVDAVGVSVLSDKVDIANARLTFASGCVANVTASRVTAKTMQKIRFFETDGYHSVDCAKRQVSSLRKKVSPDGRAEISQNPLIIPQQDPLEAEVQAFVRSIKTGMPPPVTGKEGRQSLDVALKIVECIEAARKNL
jgi:predicted dehydrogenase